MHLDQLLLEGTWRGRERYHKVVVETFEGKYERSASSVPDTGEPKLASPPIGR